MRVLGLECSTSAGSVALVEGNELKAEVWFSSPRTHSERILRGVDQVLRESLVRRQDLDGIAVGLGPGSFTGLRIALSCAKGLAFALGIPLVGVPTLEALAHNLPYSPGAVCAMLDARRETVYGGLFKRKRDGSGLESEGPCGLKDVASWVRSFSNPTVFLGDGAVAYEEKIRAILGGLALFGPPELMHPMAAVVARLGRERLVSGERAELDSLVPMYLRSSEAERARGEISAATAATDIDIAEGMDYSDASTRPQRSDLV